MLITPRSAAVPWVVWVSCAAADPIPRGIDASANELLPTRAKLRLKIFFITHTRSDRELMPLIYLQRMQISPGGAYVALANHAMASMMSIEGDVFGSCVEGVNVSVLNEYQY